MTVGGDQLFERIELFNNLRDNSGQTLKKETEDFLGSLGTGQSVRRKWHQIPRMMLWKDFSVLSVETRKK